MSENLGVRAAGPARRRAVLILGGIAAVTVLVVVALVALLLGRGGSELPPAAPPSEPVAQAPAAGDDGWDVAAQTELATRAMLELPEAASQPHGLTRDTAGPPLALPAAGVTSGRWVPGGFPATPEGALAQLAALTEAGLSGGDPQAYRQAYESVALPGAPAADTTVMYRNLQQLRAGAGLPRTGAVAGLALTYRTTSGLIKGTTHAGRYAVVCVLGEYSAQHQGRAVAGGFGDCQAMRHVDGEWRISPGAAAAKAPNAWPGTAEAVAAGYRDVVR
ncbi:hypothetical protein ACVGVM_29060 (plasmid) [Pseudonocardia bannensis]|uniref:hypothetical protein n=1 Tax=Pseudonocardia bannensis TaxID=630973 RepID=UPI001FE72B80|nr:hypothetical protein [Pseudonocardia bannensis]